MYIKNIETIYNLSTPEEIEQGKMWYSIAKIEADKIAVKYDIPLNTVVGVMSALSPNNRWERNIGDCENLIDAYFNGDHIESVKVCTYNAMRLKAWNILVKKLFTDGDILNHLNGQKIKSFFQCIMDYDACCIDGHAYNIALGVRHSLTSGKTFIGKKLYKELQDAYIKTAKKLNLKAYELQAITWVTWKRIHKI